MKTKTKTINKHIKLSELENQILEEKSKQAGLTQSEFIRRLITEEEILAKVDLTERGKLLREIGRIGNNLNQIAHALNGEYYSFPADQEKLFQSLSELEELSGRLRG